MGCRRKGTLRLTDKLKRKSSSAAMGAAVSKDKDSSQQPQQGQQPMQIGGVIAGSFQHHAHVSAAQSSTTQDAMDEMLKSINQALEAVRTPSSCYEHNLLMSLVASDGSRRADCG